MTNSINGWPVLVSTSPLLVTRAVPGTTRSIRMRSDVLPLFLALAADYHKTIAPIDTGAVDDWGYAYRQSRISPSWSDHSSGTAVDINASAEGRQGTGPLTWWQVNNHHEKAAALKTKYGVVIWGGATSLGGDYGNPVNYDWMHWAIRPGVTLAQVQSQITKLGIHPDGTTSAIIPPAAPYPGAPMGWHSKEHDALLTMQRALHEYYPTMGIRLTGTYEPAVKTAAGIIIDWKDQKFREAISLWETGHQDAFTKDGSNSGVIGSHMYASILTQYPKA